MTVIDEEVRWLSVDCCQGEGRKAYLAGLEEASGSMDVKPFAAFLAERVNE
ncbi:MULTISPECIES: hypothetical protein [unclassified Mesorhizobium]|uniref:hypothetical protein n=1 Tax=unclassified Mesorhizobium TaxID=325217 RepID=UPI0015E411A2|nr:MULTISPECIES: hypothetical protein [unclassified Mesorhizobium]MBZ9974148.1 hypothetical protein [Mesorhizobium sp. BR-1-1-10]